MSETEALSPQKQARLKLYESMTEATRPIAKKVDENTKHCIVGNLMFEYENGVMIKDIMEAKKGEATYGSDAVEKIAAYANRSVQDLYRLREFVTSFPSKSFVRDWSEKDMPNGGRLTISHWFAIMHLSESKRERYLKLTLQKSLTANQLEETVNASDHNKNPRRAAGGGRRYGKPTSAVAGLQRLDKMATALMQYEAIAEKYVFGQFDQISPEAVSDSLVKRLKQAQEHASELKVVVNKIEHRIQESLTRTERIMQKRGAAAEEEEGSVDDKPEARTGAAAPGVNGHKKSKKKHKKHKKHKPAAAATAA